jgi:hypothetical protein
MCPESRELRVVSISDCVAAKHFLCEQRLPPERDQPTGVQVLGV